MSVFGAHRPVSIEDIATKAMGETRPVIGIVPTYDPNEGVLRMNNHYAQAVVAAGGAPLIIPFTSDVSVYESLLPRIDGFVLSGGQDISPVRYGGDITYGKLSELTPEREEVEYLLLSYAYQFDFPLLGICRGMQMINVFFGGTLYLDLEEQFDGVSALDDAPDASEGVRTPAGGRVNHWQTDAHGVDYAVEQAGRDSGRGPCVGELYAPSGCSHAVCQFVGCGIWARWACGGRRGARLPVFDGRAVAPRVFCRGRWAYGAAVPRADQRGEERALPRGALPRLPAHRSRRVRCERDLAGGEVRRLYLGLVPNRARCLADCRGHEGEIPDGK